MGGGDQNPSHLVAFGRGVVGEDLRGEDGLVGRERNDFLGLEANRAVDFVVRDEGKIDLAGDRPQPGDADDDRGARELTVLPQLDDRFSDRGDVADLAVDQRPGRKADLTVGVQDRAGMADIELGGAYGARADVETNGQLCHGDAPLTYLLLTTRELDDCAVSQCTRRYEDLSDGS